MGWGLIAALLAVFGGVAINQVLDGGELSLPWGYLALVVTVLAGLAQTAQIALPGHPQGHTDGHAGTEAGEGRGKWMTRRSYLQRVRSSVDQMETIGLVTQAEFVLRTRQVYVDVALQPRPVVDTAGDSGTGPAPATTGTGKRASLAEFLIPDRVLAVLGAAGAGKTTLARYTALELAERRWWPWQRKFWRPRQIPVLLYLRDHATQILSDRPAGLAEVAVSAPWLDGTVAAAWLKRRLARGRCVVLLDGLDEVADTADRKTAVRWVENQISRYPHNTYVVTSRPLGYKESPLRNADILQVQRFTSRQIRAFLNVWYRAIEHRARQGDPRVIDQIAARAADDLYRRISTRTSLYDLAANPLLLTMIANVHRYRGSLPGGRTGLYAEMCQVLLHRRDAAKDLPPFPGLDALNEDSGDKKERIVQKLALHMMRHRLRDIPATDAYRAIRPILQRTAPDVTPETFLAYVQRSGLIVERHHQRYGFAHLTFQEYFAAALIPEHHTHRQFLVDNVSDPWWRETTLLWAARNDASPVAQACLTARTIPALHLAYTLAAEALELDPLLRHQLDRILTATSLDSEQALLLDGVAAARALQDLHTLDNGTRICAHPITRDLWNRHAKHAGTPPLPPGTEPATLWPNDIRDFLAWLNSLFTDGTSYRLPTPEEIRQALQRDLYPILDTSLWAIDNDSFRLVHHTNTLHPHRPALRQINIYQNLILDHTYLLFRLLLHRSRLTFVQLLTYSLPRDLTRPEHQLLQILDLILAIDLTRALNRAPTPASVRDLALARVHTLILATGLARTLDRDLAIDLDRNLAINRDRIPEFALNLDRVLDRTRAHVLARALTLARDLTIDRALDSDLARDLARVLDRVLDSDPFPGRVLDGDFARDLLSYHFLPEFDLALNRALDSDLTLTLDPDRARALNPDLKLTRDLDNGLALTLDRPLARDLAFARKFAATDMIVNVRLGRACTALLETFARQRTTQSGHWSQADEEATGGPFSAFLARALAEFSSQQPVDDLEDAFDQAERLARKAHVHGNCISGMDELVQNARTLAAPLWDRSQPDVPQGSVVQAAASLLAALVTRSDHETDAELAELLSGTLAALIALTPGTRPHDTSRLIKLLVLVRN